MTEHGQQGKSDRELLEEVVRCLRGPVGDSEHSGLVGMVASLRRDVESLRRDVDAVRQRLEEIEEHGAARRPLSKAKVGAWLSAVAAGLGWLLDALIRQGK